MAHTVEGQEGTLKFHDGTIIKGEEAEKWMKNGELFQGR
jgi:hypothetical protein